MPVRVEETKDEISKYIAKLDWSTSLIGAPKTWAPTLRLTLDTILRSTFPMLLFWGEDYILFYNAAFRRSLDAGKHPQALGQPAGSAWIEAFHILGPILDQVRNGGDAVWKDDLSLPLFRNGSYEQTAWTISVSAVSDETGAIGGVLATCLEIKTNLPNVPAQQEHHTNNSGEQILHAFENIPVALATIDRHRLTFTNANPFYAELVGRKPADLVNKPLLEALPEIAGQGFDLIIQNVIETGVPFNAREVPVDLIRNDRLETIYVNLVYQPQYDKDRQITSVLVVAIDITGEVLSRRVFEQSEAKFRSLIDEAPVATCLFVGREMKVELANDVMLSYWGKDRSILGLPLEEAIPELEGQPFLKILDDVFTTGMAYTQRGAEARLQQNGQLETFYFDFTYKPLRNPHGEVYAIMDMALDVTESVNARKRLQESERYAREIFYNSPVANLVYTGREMVLKEANEAMLKIFGRTEAILDWPIMESIPELKESDLLEKYLRVLDTGKTHYEEAQRILLIKDGEPYWGYYDYIYKPLFDLDNHVYGVNCTAIDVTSETTSRQQIQEAEASLRSAIELAELATWSIDLVEKKIHYSARLQQWLGVETSVLEIDASPRIHPKDRERIGKAIQKALQPGGNGHFDEKYTIINIVTGQNRVIHANGIAKFGNDGAPISISGTAQDVTLQQELQTALQNIVLERTEALASSNRQLEITNKELLYSNEKLSQYAYVASHDLQEPLRKIQIYSSRLHQHKLDPEIKKDVEKINESAARMRLLITGLLEFSRLLDTEQEKQAVDLNKIVRNVAADFELLLTEKNGQLIIGPLPVLNAIPLQMNQLLYNLIGNALKFTRPNTASIVSISSGSIAHEELPQEMAFADSKKNFHRISVADNGIGFEQEFSERIFETFRRLHNKDDFPGSGIGLTLCRRIANNHGGTIYTESIPGEGSVFHVILEA